MARVLMVGKGEPERGGIPSFITTLLHSELGSRHDIEFLNVARGGTLSGGRATLGNVVRTLRDAVAVWRSAKGFDIVHIHTSLAPSVTMIRASLLVLAAGGRGCRTLLHAHGGLIGDWLSGPVRIQLGRAALFPADHIVTVSQNVEEPLLRLVPRSKVTLVENGVDTEMFAPSPRQADRLRVLYVGLLTPRKGVIDLFSASSILARQGVDHELWLVGGTPTEGYEAERQVRQAAASLDHVRWLGERPHEDMPGLLAEVDIFCLPSWWEAMPLSVLEAMSCGLPVVATHVGDVARLVEDTVTGLIVPPRSVDQLAAALGAVLRDPQMRVRMGAAGRGRASEVFSMNHTVRAIESIYRQVLAST
jgi:glycosyltransferase involved in cell wall biosynthesis